MVIIKVKNLKGQEIEGEWNEKFYAPQIEGNSEGIYRIYIDNNRVHINEKEKERIIKEQAEDKIKEDNRRISLILSEFKKLDEQAKKHLIAYLEMEVS